MPGGSQSQSASSFSTVSAKQEHGSRLTWSQRPTASCNSLLVQAALRESVSRRLRLVKSSLGGGLAPVDDDTHTPQQQSRKNSITIPNSHIGCDGSPSNSNDNRAATGFGVPVTQFTSIRSKKQRDIAHILPVIDVKRMTQAHWADLCSLERRYLPIDWYPPKESPILGVKQLNINRDHRHRIVKWMGEACGLFKWTAQTFFTAVHAWDVYMTVAPHEVTTADLAKLSAACLYFGAQLVESAADENVKPLEEFTELCPEVGDTSALREIQAHLVDTLQGISLVRRTPIDFLLLFLAQMQIAPSPCPELFESLLHQNLLDVLWDLVLAVSLAIYANGLVLDGLPGSRWVAGSMLRVLEFACPALRSDANAREVIRKHVFHLPAGALDKHQATVLDPIIKAVWQLILEAVTREGSMNESGHLESHHNREALSKKALPYVRPLDNPAFYIVLLEEVLSIYLYDPQDIIRHHLPPSFPQWSITFPNNRIVQEVSARLRATSFETFTPPNVYATGSSVSASKRAGEKSRRQSSVSISLPQAGLASVQGIGGRGKNNPTTDENSTSGTSALEGRRCCL